MASSSVSSLLHISRHVAPSVFPRASTSINRLIHSCIRTLHTGTVHHSDAPTAATASSNERVIPISVHTTTAEAGGPHPSYDAEEVDKFRPIAGQWWSLDGPFKLLHSLNDLRVPLIRDGILQTSMADASVADGPRPLTDSSVLDVGCGGGILCEALAKLGADVTGLDASAEAIDAATKHKDTDQRLRQSTLQYRCEMIEDHVLQHKEHYDAVVASEVLEHVSNVEKFVDSCTECLKPGGSLFITTINRTPQSYLGAILAAEYVLGLVPKGTHDWNKFVKVEELLKMIRTKGYSVRVVHGMACLAPLNRWCWVRDTSINYALHAVKTR